MNWNWTGRAQISLNGLDRTPVEWTRLDWARPLQKTGLSQTTTEDWTGRHCTSLDWTVVVWAWLHQTALHCTTRRSFQKTKLDGIAPNWTRLSLLELDFTRLHYTHCTTLDWTGKYHTGHSLYLARLICTELHSTFLNETDKDCTALYLNVLHWTRPHRIA